MLGDVMLPKLWMTSTLCPCPSQQALRHWTLNRLNGDSPLGRTVLRVTSASRNAGARRFQYERVVVIRSPPDIGLCTVVFTRTTKISGGSQPNNRGSECRERCTLCTGANGLNRAPAASLHRERRQPSSLPPCHHPPWHCPVLHLLSPPLLPPPAFSRGPHQGNTAQSKDGVC